LIARLNVGGPAIHTILLTDKLRERGYETMLVSGREGEREGNMYALAEERGVEPVFIEELGREVSFRDDYTSYKAVCRLIHEFKPHIVHTHTAKAGAIGRIAAHRCKVPVIVHTFHGHVLRGYFGPIKNEIYRRVEKYLARRSTCLVTVSARAKDELSSLGVAPAEKFVPIPLGLDLERFRDAHRDHHGELRAELGLSADAYLVGIVARLAPVKNHYEFFAGVERVAPDHPHIQFVVVGDGPLRDELEGFVRSKPWAKQVHFLGMRHDLVRIYGDLDLAVLTSKNEGLPVALIEALAAGIPILGSDVGATHELLGPCWAAGVYPPGNIEQLVVSILEGSRGRRDYSTITREVKDHIIQRYGIERLAQDLDGLYRSLLGRVGLP
jgi:glycosyltransferase involved in cell wall biosynthesis